MEHALVIFALTDHYRLQRNRHYYPLNFLPLVCVARNYFDHLLDPRLPFTAYPDAVDAALNHRKKSKKNDIRR